MFKLIAIREDGSYRLHLEKLTTVAEAETALKFAIGQDGIVDGFVLRADEPIPSGDGRTYAQRVADFHAAMAVPVPVFGGIHRNHQFAKDAQGAHIGVHGCTKFTGNYAFKPGVGWYRIHTLAAATWNA